MRRALLLMLVLTLLAPAAVHAADYGPGAEPVSVDYGKLEQGDDGTQDADITADGRYVAIQTRATNFFADGDPDPPGLLRRGGIFRFDRETRLMAFVADGDQIREDGGSLVLRGAANPSISDDGRYVVFSTAQKLTPADTNDNVDVYRRDMSIPVGADRAVSVAYTLVSARDGSDAPATYAPRVPPLPGRNPGADVTANVAISADGSRVAFRTVELASDLPDRPGTDTPPGQIFVRDLAGRRTILASAASTDGSPAGGATGPAVLSTDGSTVVWVGGNAAQQTRFLPGERTDESNHYYLWRRVDGGSTRRVTGMADPDDPACAPGFVVQLNPVATGACYGPLTSFEEENASLVNAVPAVSADGNRVAFLTSQGIRPTNTNQTALDAFVADMSPGVTRKAGTLELTRDPQGGNPASAGGIRSVAMAADGSHVALVTSRTNFVLPTFSPTSASRSFADVGEIYIFDLGARTIDRVVRSAGAGDANGDAGDAVTLSRDGGVVAFTSIANNLFFGDANSRTDAFATTRVVPRTGGGAPPPDANQPDPGFTIDDPEIDLQVSLERRKDGGIDVRLKAPAAGTFQLAASTSSAKGRSASAAATKKVTVATATRKVTKKSSVTIALKPGATARGLLKKTKRVAVTVRIVFAPKAAGSSSVTDTQTGSFVRPRSTSKNKSKAAVVNKSTPRG